MTKLIGSEVMTYRSAVPTGVPRVIRETHRYLLPALAESGMELVPVVTSHPPEVSETLPNPYIASDSVLGKPLRFPRDVDALLLMQASTTTDFTSLVRARRERRLPIIAIVYDVLPLHHPEWFIPESDRSFRVLLQQILHVADHIVVSSQAVADDLHALQWNMRAEVHRIPFGTSFSQKPPRPPMGPALDVLYVATLEPRKGHRTLLAAFDMLRESGVPVRLTFVGRQGWLADDLVQSIRDHEGFGSSLRWLASADDECILELLQECTVAVVPTEGEGFGLFLEEALSAGVMVVANDLPVFRERPNPNVEYFDGSSADLAAMIVDAANRRPISLSVGDVRTMRDFSEDLRQLIVDVVASDHHWTG